MSWVVYDMDVREDADETACVPHSLRFAHELTALKYLRGLREDRTHACEKEAARRHREWRRADEIADTEAAALAAVEARIATLERTKPVKSLVLLSGGIDSALLLWRADPGSAALFVDYGQPSAREEARAARALAAARGAALHEAVAPLPLGAMSAPAGAAGARIVPGRNLALCALGTSVALSIGAVAVWLGAQAGDATDYPDCRADFLAALDRVTAATYGVHVLAPLIMTSRGSVIREARALGVPLTLCWSCYAPNAEGLPCGTCNSCRQER